MSRIASPSSASGVRVAAQPLSNVYTVLLLIGALCVAAAAVMECITLQSRYGSILPVGDAGEQTRRDIENAVNQQKAQDAELDQMQENLSRWPQGSGAAPASEAADEAAPAPSSD